MLKVEADTEVWSCSHHLPEGDSSLPSCLWQIMMNKDDDHDHAILVTEREHGVHCLCVFSHDNNDVRKQLRGRLHNRKGDGFLMNKQMESKLTIVVTRPIFHSTHSFQHWDAQCMFAKNTRVKMNTVWDLCFPRVAQWKAFLRQKTWKGVSCEQKSCAAAKY